MAGRPKVYSIAIEVTAHCQQKCAYCYNPWREDNGSGMEAGGAKKLHARVDKVLSRLDVDHVTITGGEPFTRRDIFELLDLVKSKGVGIQLISNGGLIDDALAARLAPYGVWSVQVTLDGPSAELHDEQVGGEGHFDRTIAGIGALRRAGVRVIGCVVVTRKNARHVGEIVTVFRDLGVRHVALSRFSPAGYAARHVAELLPSREDLLVAFRQAIPLAETTGDARMRFTSTMPVPPCAVETEELAPLEFGTCSIGTAAQEFALGPDGRLRHCTLHGGGLGAAKDVLDPDVDPAALVAGAEGREYKRQLPEFCVGCIHAATCGGGCGAGAEWVLGHARKFPDPFVWQHVDDAFAGRLASEREAPRARRRLEVIA